MRQYWINFKGKQEGPMSMEQMAAMGIDDTAFVWHSGLPDWVKITSVPELNEMLQQSKDVAQEDVPELPQDSPDEVVDVSQGPDPYHNDYGLQPQAVYQENQAPNRYQLSNQEPQQSQEVPQCPPTNLVWSIIVTVLCCTPAGIVGIVFAFLTKKHYREGNFAKAQRMSDYGAWAVIASIILGIITTPLSCAMQMGKMMM